MEVKDRNIKGYPIVFNSMSEQMVTIQGDEVVSFKEHINAQALDHLNINEQDIIFNIEHDDKLMLARTKSGTLRCTIDTVGLLIDADIADTTLGKDVLTMLERGDLDQMSARWRVKTDRWYRDENLNLIREIMEFEYIKDITLTGRPAYKSTLAMEDKRTLEQFIEDEKRSAEKESQLTSQAIAESEYLIHKYKY
jgi:HK97 family phage prohead protease